MKERPETTIEKAIVTRYTVYRHFVSDDYWLPLPVVLLSYERSSLRR
jgi:hypothetical protein